MRHSSCSSVRLAVKALNEEDFLGCQAGFVEPPVSLVIPHAECLSITVRVDQANWDQVLLYN